MNSMLFDMENTQRYAKQIAAGEVGEITIGYPGSITYFVLPESLDIFVKKFPFVRVKLIELMAESLERVLLNFQLDAEQRPAAQINKVF